MKVLWIVNLLLPQLSERIGVHNSFSGTWLFEWSKKLNNSNNEFAVACVYGKEFKKIRVGKTLFYLLPGNGKNMLFYTKRFEKIWKNIVKDFKPDIINIHGTEYSHGLSCMRSNPKERYIVSMQGILGEIKKVDYGGLTFKDLFFNRTLKENIKFNGLFENHFIHVKNSKYEKEMIKRADAIAYVNDFDYEFARRINSSALFFNIDYDMQETFKKSEKWRIDNGQKHLIFTNPGGTPLKGLHQLIKALYEVKKVFSDVALIVPGMGDGNNLIVKNGYSKYISKLIKKLNLVDNIKFLNYQTPEQMRDNMLKANVVVIPSAVEGTSLILREAMYLGCICIASRRGGMRNYINDGVDGFQYEYADINALVEKIEKVFLLNDQDAFCISRKAIEKTCYYDSSISYDSLIRAYIETINIQKNK